MKSTPVDKSKPVERKRVESNVEKEVDRIIDSQDNVYVLSKPKCVEPLFSFCYE